MHIPQVDKYLSSQNLASSLAWASFVCFKNVYLFHINQTVQKTPNLFTELNCTISKKSCCLLCSVNSSLKEDTGTWIKPNYA